MPQRYTRPLRAHSGRSMGDALRIAARGDVDGLRDILDRAPGLLSASSAGHNRTLLWEAVRHGRRAAVEFLVERGADLNVPGRYRHETLVLITPYCVARRRRDDDLAGYLLARGSVVDAYRAAFLGDCARLDAALTEDPDRQRVVRALTGLRRGGRAPRIDGRTDRAGCAGRAL